MATNRNALSSKDIYNPEQQPPSSTVSAVDLTEATEFISRVGKQLQQLLAESQLADRNANGS
jgi:hypothetical protein